MGDDLLQTKLFFPPTQPNLAPRGQILARLTEKHCQDSKLTLLSAPAGFGKTTLAANWLHEANIQVAWVLLGVEDDDPARFLAYLLAVLRQHNVGTGETIQGMLVTPKNPQWSFF